MEIVKVNDIVKFDSKEELIKCLLYIKLSEKNIQLSDNELNVLTLFSSTYDKDVNISHSLEKKYVRSKQSGENCVSKLTILGLLVKTGIGKRKINKTYFPEIKSDYLAAKLVIHNLNVTN